MSEHWRDGGYKSRKLWFCVFAVGVLFLGMAFVVYHSAAIGLYDTFVGGVVALAGLFLTGSVATKLVATKMPTTQVIKKDEAPGVTPEGSAKPPVD